ncbi:microtubule-associated protein futsch [Nematolebias whitei]|uniref:microtubule-associated protein futsch n=1 Tax=Nematolebias whitei TaxID=451745 RepID=UPI00189BC9FE|nr:microtubule-associated protein futsch [Nematolebias whitei]
MPAPKRGSTPHDSQPKMRKLDEDGEALPTKIESATNSLITEKKQENTAAAPRTKIKRLLVEKGNTPAKSSKQSSPPKDSSKSPSDPPVKKAKLLTATSASCGEAPSQRANSKASLKQTTSTESDDDLSSDGSKVEFFREKDDEDEACCIGKYSNKAKRKVELSSDLQEMSQDLSSSPSDPVQIDHNYGRFSDSTSLQNTGVAEDKDSVLSFTEQESQEISHNATQKVPTDTSTSETGSAETSIKVESATDEHKDVELQFQDSQTLVDHKTPAFSREVADCVTPVGEKKEKQDATESTKSLNDADDKTLASPEKTLCAVTGELISGARVVDERTDSACQSESQTCLIIQSVSEENELNIKSETKEQEVSEAAGICADKLDGVLLKVTSSVLEHKSLVQNLQWKRESRKSRS